MTRLVGVVEETGRELFAERERIQRLERVRQLVFGSLDGLLVPLGVITGVAAGTGSAKAVTVAGLAEAFAGALSMGAGEFISGRSEAQVQRAEVSKAETEIADQPEYELQEMAPLFEHEGVSAVDARLIASTLARYPDSYEKTMIEKELGIPSNPVPGKIPEALTMGASYIVASILPLVAYFFLPISQAFIASLGLTLLALVAVGIIKGKLAQLNLL